jgi:O-acetylserine/cysteine efflux transporter
MPQKYSMVLNGQRWLIGRMIRGSSLPARHIALAALPVLIWGVNFTVLDSGLAAFPPLLFAALRFALVAVGCLFVPRPKVAWRWLLLIGLFTGTGQYALLYLGMAAGMPAGLSALVMQAQVPLTILFAALALRERPAARQSAGIAVSALGLGLVGLARGGSVTAPSLLLVLGAAASWAVGNACTRIARPDNGFRLVIWSSLVPPLPLLGLSLLHEGARRDAASFGHAGWAAWSALAYAVLLSTVLAMGAWSLLLSRYQADRVVPFALAIPVVGLATGHLVQGEPVAGPMLLGAAVVLTGLALVVAPARRVSPRTGPPESARVPRQSSAPPPGSPSTPGSGRPSPDSAPRASAAP